MAELQKIASLICQTARVAIMGINQTAFSASQLSYRLSKLGVANYLVTDRVVMADYMEIFGPGDACLIFSISTTSINYKEIVQRLKKNGASVVLFTMNASSPLKKTVRPFYLPSPDFLQQKNGISGRPGYLFCVY